MNATCSITSSKTFIHFVHSDAQKARARFKGVIAQVIRQLEKASNIRITELITVIVVVVKPGAGKAE